MTQTTTPSTAATAPNPNPDLPVEVGALVEAYEGRAEWIRFADAKAGTVLTANTALVGLLVPTISELLVLAKTPKGPLVFVPLGLFVLAAAFAVTSALHAFQ